MLVGGILLFFVDTKKGGIEASTFSVSAEVKLEELISERPDLIVEPPVEDILDPAVRSGLILLCGYCG